ncbi:hypothetical protein CPB83DRAFT_99811 [Crepidotus variabilis]|uniref:Secreted protein n=1 Tax=Crepidotus variabilis TaxID=179855 RepID=A0A9P6EM58_9AGAR|nr:hypothetical protein CPB83DRAFT_99811 [Crepidotus variabilis]
MRHVFWCWHLVSLISFFPRPSLRANTKFIALDRVKALVNPMARNNFHSSTRREEVRVCLFTSFGFPPCNRVSIFRRTCYAVFFQIHMDLTRILWRCCGVVVSFQRSPNQQAMQARERS